MSKYVRCNNYVGKPTLIEVKDVAQAHTVLTEMVEALKRKEESVLIASVEPSVLINFHFLVSADVTDKPTIFNRK